MPTYIIDQDGVSEEDSGGSPCQPLVRAALMGPLEDLTTEHLWAAHQMVALGAYFAARGCKGLGRLFYHRADRLRSHGLKIVDFLIDAGIQPNLGAIGAAGEDFGGASAAVARALEIERQLAGHVQVLNETASREDDYLTQAFLRKFHARQLNGVAEMTALLEVVEHAGDNLLLADEHARHLAH